MKLFSAEVWALLDHPLILVGFVVFLALSTYRFLLATGIIPTISQRAGGAVIKSLVRYIFYVAIIGMFLGFGIRLFELSLEKNGDGDHPQRFDFSEVQVSENGTDREFLIAKLGVPEQSDPKSSGFDLFGVGDQLWLVDYFEGEAVGKSLLGDLSNTSVTHPYNLYQFPEISSVNDIFDTEKPCDASLRIPNEFTGGAVGKELDFVVISCGGFNNAEGFRDWGVYTDHHSFLLAVEDAEKAHTLESRLQEARCVSVNWSDPEFVDCNGVEATSAGGIALEPDEVDALVGVAKEIPVWGFFECSFFGYGIGGDQVDRSGCYALEEILLSELTYVNARFKN